MSEKAEHREPGYYWVNDGEWMIAEWRGEEWVLPGQEVYFEDDDFEEIDERRIERDAGG